MRILILLLTLCFSMPALAAETVSVTYSEPEGASFRFWAEKTAGEHAVYLFDPAVDVQTRHACMEAAENVLRHLPLTEKVEICLVPSRLFTGAVIVGNRLYIGPMDWQRVEFAALVLQTAAGEFSHYGLVYGFAGYLRGETGVFAVMQDAAAYDLNLLCFDEAFVPAEDAHNARLLSICFASEYIETYGEAAYISLLLESDTAEGMDRAAGALQVYYADHGVAEEVSALRLARGGKAYHYRVAVEGASFRVGLEWQDLNHELNPLVSETFLHEDYAAVRDFFCINESQMALYRQLCASAGPWENNVEVLLLNPQRKTTTSRYLAAENRIWLLNVDSLTHEYIHALMPSRSGQTLWETEGIARYFSFYYDHYGWAFLNEDYNNPPELDHVQFIRDYRAAVGRPIDMRLEFGELESLGAYSRKDQSPDESYASGSAFVHYLVQRFGEEAVIRHVRGLESLPQDVSSLTADWHAWLDERYRDFPLSST